MENLPNRGRPRKEGSIRKFYCSFGACKSNGKKCGPEVQFFPFQKPCLEYRNAFFGSEFRKKHNKNACSECSRCLKWLHLSRRCDGRLNIDTVGKGAMVCSKHFQAGVDANVRTDDPIAATNTLPVKAPRRKLIRKNVGPLTKRKYTSKVKKKTPTEICQENENVFEVNVPVMIISPDTGEKDNCEEINTGNSICNTTVLPTVDLRLQENNCEEINNSVCNTTVLPIVDFRLKAFYGLIKQIEDKYAGVLFIFKKSDAIILAKEDEKTIISHRLTIKEDNFEAKIYNQVVPNQTRKKLREYYKDGVLFLIEVFFSYSSLCRNIAKKYINCRMINVGMPHETVQCCASCSKLPAILKLKKLKSIKS